MRNCREQFAQPNARRPPFVLKGDTISSLAFWHGNFDQQRAGISAAQSLAETRIGWGEYRKRLPTAAPQPGL